MINEQELAEAVDRLREGDDSGLLVKYGQVMEKMRYNPNFVPTLMVKLFECDNDIQEYFEEKFNEAAADLLIQAKENELTHRAELNEIEAFAERNNVRMERACVMLGKNVNRYNQLKGE